MDAAVGCRAIAVAEMLLPSGRLHATSCGFHHCLLLCSKAQMKDAVAWHVARQENAWLCDRAGMRCYVAHAQTSCTRARIAASTSVASHQTLTKAAAAAACERDDVVFLPSLHSMK
jgi:hypothetical protein